VKAQSVAVAGLLACGTLMGIAQSARAHELPRGVALHWATPDAADPALIVTNRGLIYADAADSGYALRCNEATGATQARMPHVWLTDAGKRTFVVTDDRLRYSDDLACGFSDAMGLPANTLFTALAAGGAGPAVLLLAVLEADGSHTTLYASDDQGLHFAPRGAPLSDETWDALLIAPSDTSRVYAGGKHIDRSAQRLISIWSYSRDGGRTFTRMESPVDRTPVFVHPAKADLVFAAQPTDALKSAFELLRSDDGGATFRSVLTGLSTLPLLALGAADGELWLGTGRSGALYHATDGGEHFTKVHDEVHEVHCLIQRGDTLWLCGNFAPNTDGVFAADAKDGEFRPFLTFDQVRAPVPCADTVCVVPFADYARELFPDAGTPDAGTPDASTSAEQAADGGGPDAAAPTDDDVTLDAGPRAAAHQSGCSIAAKGRSHSGTWLGLLMLIAISRRLQRSFSRRASTSGFSGSRR
jgi:hypothetical protein